MKPRSLVLALMSCSGVLTAPVQAATDCNQLFVYAVQQFCSVAPNGQSLCQPFGLVGPAPSCALPGATPNLSAMPLAPAVPQASPYNPYLGGALRGAPNPYLATPGTSAVPYMPFQPFPLPSQAAPIVPLPPSGAPAAVPAPQAAAPASPTASPTVSIAPALKPAPAPAAAPSAVKPVVPSVPTVSVPAPVAPPVPVAVSAPVAPPAVTPPAATAPVSRPANPYLIHSGISVGSPLPSVKPAPAAVPAPTPAPAPVVKPAPATIPVPVPAPTPVPVVEAPKPALPPARPVEEPKPAVVVTPAAPPAPPAPAPVTPQAKALASEAVVLFRFNSSRLTPAARALLDDWAAGAPKGAKIYVTGHADRIGSARYNKKLSLRRAKAVRAYLVSKRMKAQSIQVAAKGYAAPVKACDGKVSRAIIVCLAPNRRVEVKP